MKKLSAHDERLTGIESILGSHTETLKSHTEIFKSHGEMLKSHGEILQSHTETLKSHTETLKSHGEQLDVIASTVLEHSEKLKTLDVINEKIDKLPTAEMLSTTINKIDKLLTKAAGTEQERLMWTHALRRVEDKTDKNAKDIQQIKPLVGLA